MQDGLSLGQPVQAARLPVQPPLPGLHEGEAEEPEPLQVAGEEEKEQEPLQVQGEEEEP